MWVYEKKLLYPVNVDGTDCALAKMIVTAYGGPYINKLQFGVKKITIIYV